MVLPWIELNDEHGHVPVTRLGSGYASPEMLCLGPCSDGSYRELRKEFPIRDRFLSSPDRLKPWSIFFFSGGTPPIVIICNYSFPLVVTLW